jgi:hypothetical protein
VHTVLTAVYVSFWSVAYCNSGTAGWISIKFGSVMAGDDTFVVLPALLY